MMSGQLASKIGAYDNGAEFPVTIPTYAHTLRNNGYQTILSGKMHFVGLDQLYDLENDPLVFSNIINRPELASIAKEFHTAVEQKLDQDIRLSQRRRRLVNKAMKKGAVIDWDFSAERGCESYFRGQKPYNKWAFEVLPLKNES